MNPRCSVPCSPLPCHPRAGGDDKGARQNGTFRPDSEELSGADAPPPHERRRGRLRERDLTHPTHHPGDSPSLIQPAQPCILAVVQPVAGGGWAVDRRPHIMAGQKMWLLETAHVYQTPAFTVISSLTMDEWLRKARLQTRDCSIQYTTKGRVRRAVETPRPTLKNGVAGTYNIFQRRGIAADLAADLDANDCAGL